MTYPSIILDNLYNAVLLFDNELVLTVINPAGEALLRASRNKVIGRTADELLIESGRWSEMLNSVRTLGMPLVERGLSWRRLDGDEITVDVVLTPLSEQDGGGLLAELQQVDRQSHIMHDEQLMSQRDNAFAIIRGLAHEIRNPLGGLRGAAQLLERELSEPELREYTDVIIEEADRLQKLLDRMLGPRNVPQKRDISIHEVTDRVCRLISVEAAGGVEIECDYDPSIPHIHADPDLLIQAVLNVARNAVQAVGTEGRITVRTRIKRQLTIGAKRYRLVLKLDVIDTGPGVPEDMREKIFYPMVSGTSHGTGLGLSISQNLIQKHDGLIFCNSKNGLTVMSILLPLENNSD